MKDYKILKFLDLFKKIFVKLGIDYQVMREILKVKLTLDTRRSQSVMVSDNNNIDEEKNQFLKSLPIYLIFGLPLIFFVTMDISYIFSMSLLFGIFMFFMMTSLVSDFSSVLLDIRDKNIILTKPVESITLNMAKIIHILYYVSMITLALVLPSLIVSIFSKGIVFFLLYLATIILLDLFIIMLTALLYLLILKLFSGEKLKDIINYVQISLTIAITLSYQVIGRLFDISELLEINFNPTWWSGLLPPVWFASVFELLIARNTNTFIVIYSLLALIIPIVSIIIYIKLIPSFERNLQKLNDEDTNKKRKHRFSNSLSNIISRTKEEKTLFDFSSNIMKNERNFKLRVYPNLGFSMIFPFIMAFSSGTSSILTIYFVGFAFLTILQLIKYSDSYKAAWIYKFFEIDENTIYRATLKSVFMNLITPIFILISIIFFFILKENILIDLMIAYISLNLGFLLLFITGPKTLPFTEKFGAVKDKGSILDAFRMLFILGGLALAHFIAGMFPYGKYIYLLVIIIVDIIAWRKALKAKESYEVQYN
ncbi:MAG: hypothetical protein ACTHVE_06815 [Senegalia sp. (in: firmicutes)]|uniref:hypothetical protein n=1 Tax=Senegalia sp. (in: firmicutes) TaxID=1924098 RepID=UPI003F9D5827